MLAKGAEWYPSHPFSHREYVIDQSPVGVVLYHIRIAGSLKLLLINLFTKDYSKNVSLFELALDLRMTNG